MAMPRENQPNPLNHFATRLAPAYLVSTVNPPYYRYLKLACCKISHNWNAAEFAPYGLEFKRKIF
jgi:hypothetical protein